LNYFENQGLTLDLEALEHIKNVKFANKKLDGFKITKHLNYEDSIAGLKIPLTYEEVVKNPAILQSISRKEV
jgi:hypothetical protein